MKARILLVSLLVGVVCSVWAAEPVPATSASTSAVAQPQPGDPAYGFNWFNPYAWMALANPATWSAGTSYTGTSYSTNAYLPASAPTAQQSAASSNAPAGYATYPAGFNWFDPNAWMAMFFNPNAWGYTGQPGAAPAGQNPATAYPNNFNVFNPYAWAAMFNPAAWNTASQVPAGAPAK